MRKYTYILLSLLAVGGMAGAQRFEEHSPLAAGEWFRLGVQEEGMYKVSPAQVASMRGKRFAEVALYGQCGGMMGETNLADDVTGLVLLPVGRHDGNGNGVVDEGDYVFFYAEGASVWRYNQGLARFAYERHSYATTNYYYLTTTADTAAVVGVLPSGNTAAATLATRFTAVAVHDNDLQNAYGTGRIYVGEKFTSAVASRTVDVALPATPAGEIDCRYAFSALSATNAVATITLGGESEQRSLPFATGYREFRKSFPTVTASTLHFTVGFSASGAQAAGFLDYIEVNFPAELRYHGGQEVYRFVPGGDSVFRIEGVSATTRLWEVSDNYGAREVEVERQGTGGVFGLSAGEPHRVVAFEEGSLLAPASVVGVENQDLHALKDVDYVIVSHRNWLEQANRIAELHRVEDMMTVAVVTDEQVYNEFSAGKQDPMAIRMLMRMLYRRAKADASLRAPRYLLLFGKGSYDPRDIEGLGQATVVTYESRESYSETNSYCSDDLFGYLDNGESGQAGDGLDLAIGRLSVRSEEEARHLVDQIIDYTHRKDLGDADVRGDWRSYVTLLADDADPSSPGDTIFAHSAEVLARRIKATTPALNVERVYADAYLQQSGAVGSFYPEVNNALKKRIDYGTILLNYIGHGSIQYIGTERYVTFSDIDNYANDNRQTFLVTSTCSYGKYDVPDEISGAEYLMNARGGAVGVISAARPIFHNERFNTDLCLLLLDGENTVGEALRKAKNNTNVSPSIALLGDPAMRLSLPQDEVVVASINHHALTEGCKDSASALSEVVVAGEVRDLTGTIVSDFEGMLFATVFDRETPASTLANDNEGTELDFVQQKNVLFKGGAEVREGRFEYSFVVPRDINFTYAPGKLSHYAHNGVSDAAGCYSNLYFGGFDTTAFYDVFRPTIRLFINDTNFRDGGTTDGSPTLLAMLSDSVGINAIGSGIGHDITATLDGRGNTTMVLNDFFEQDIDDSRQGTLRYTLSDLAAGWHTLTLKAWNIYNYSASASISFYVADDEEGMVGLFRAYPNPATQRVLFRVEHNGAEKIAEAVVEVYDYLGQRVAVLRPAVAQGSYVAGPVEWDFSNEAGSRLPSGIYVARLTLKTHSGKEITETTRVVKIQ